MQFPSSGRISCCSNPSLQRLFADPPSLSTACPRSDKRGTAMPFRALDLSRLHKRNTSLVAQDLDDVETDVRFPTVIYLYRERVGLVTGRRAWLASEIAAYPTFGGVLDGSPCGGFAAGFRLLTLFKPARCPHEYFYQHFNHSHATASRTRPKAQRLSFEFDGFPLHPQSDMSWCTAGV